jgi:hypothetical protein
MEFEKMNWRSAHYWLEIKQEELIKAYKNKDTSLIIQIQVSILKDYSTTRKKYESKIIRPTSTMSPQGT